MHPLTPALSPERGEGVTLPLPLAGEGRGEGGASAFQGQLGWAMFQWACDACVIIGFIYITGIAGVSVVLLLGGGLIGMAWVREERAEAVDRR